jgi:hypothetical protein
MRINFRALGITVGGCMIALFLYVMLTLPGCSRIGTAS